MSSLEAENDALRRDLREAKATVSELHTQVKESHALSEREVDRVRMQGEALAEKVSLLERELENEQQSHLESLELVLRENEDLKV